MPRADIDARDRNILSHILAYCNDIAVTHSEFGYSVIQKNAYHPLSCNYIVLALATSRVIMRARRRSVCNP